MPTLLRMPEVAADATHAVLHAWTANKNDQVETGDCLAEIETDKAIVELAAEQKGRLVRHLVKAGAQVPIGEPIAVLLHDGESEDAIDAFIASGGARTPENAAAEPSTVSTALVEGDAGVRGEARVVASPVARRLAQERGLDLTSVRGSGPHGRVVKRDVETAATDDRQNAIVPPANQGTAQVGGVPLLQVTTAIAFNDVPHTSMRRAIARRLSESKSTIPHFYLKTDCRMDRLVALRAEVNATSPRKISVNDYIVRAAALALKEIPDVNVGWTEGAMRYYTCADVAVAVSTEGGLITPIVRRADTKSISEISAEIASLAMRARAGQLRPEEYQGGSFSVSNLGMYGVSEFSAIINPPHSAILAVGATQSVPVVRDGQLAVAQVMRCTLSVDHRAVDGALAAQWLAAFQRLIEKPLSLLM